MQTRVRQALQIMETQYSDLDIAVVAPDSETLSTLHCSLEGKPLIYTHEHWFAPGEVRLLDYRDRVENTHLRYDTASVDKKEMLARSRSSASSRVLRINNFIYNDGPESLFHPHPGDGREL